MPRILALLLALLLPVQAGAAALRTVAMPTLPGRAAATLAWLDQKAPGSTLDYSLDITAWLGADTVVSASAGVAPSSGLTITTQPTAGSVLTVWLTGGTAGTNYAVTFTVSTAAGRTLVETIWLYCQNLSPAPAVAPTVQAVIPATNLPLGIVGNAVTLLQEGATTGQALVWSGSAWAPGTVSGAPGGSSGQLQANIAGALAGVPAISGDGTLNTSTGALAITKIGGVSVSLGGALTTTGAYTIGLTATGNTALTLPTAGTLATQGWVTGQLLTADGTTITNSGGTISVGTVPVASVAGAASSASVTSAINAALPSIATTAPLTGCGSAGCVQAATGTLVLPNGTVATTPAASDNSARVATAALIKLLQSWAALGPYTTGVFVGPGGSNTTLAVASNYIRLHPAYVTAGSTTLKSITWRYTVAPSSAYPVEGCVYTMGAGGVIGPIVTGGDTNAVSSGTAVATTTTSFPSAVTLPEGGYWVGVLHGGSATGTMAAVANTLPFLANTAGGAVTNLSFYSAASVTVGSVGSTNCPSYTLLSQNTGNSWIAAMGF